MDKVHTCIDLLCEQNYIERKPTLRETYESVVGVYNLERDSQKMWDMVKDHKINSLFQFEKMSGVNGINLTNPRSVGEMAVLNSVIRLMASDKGAEQPLDKWARYRKNINEWYNEMRVYGLDKEDMEWLSSYPGINNGICESQEGLMMLVQEERLGGNSLSFADKCRKGIAKKQGKLFEECEKEYFKNAKEKGCNDKLVNYVWNVLFKVQRGYSFNLSHTYSYSLIALQEMNLAYKYPIIFWNCACLISDCGGNEDEDNDEEVEEKIEEIEYDDSFEDFAGESEDDDDEDDDEEETKKSAKKKEKTKNVEYGKIASAIGKFQSSGVSIAPPSINESSFTFSPDVKSNTILYGLSGIVKVGQDFVKEIIANRPYESVDDFVKRLKPTKPQMINLIKSGAFDTFGDRQEIMKSYLYSVADLKSTVNLRNMKRLLELNLIPDKYDLQRRVYNFNKYVKSFKDESFYLLDNVALAFIDKYFSIDNLVQNEKAESGFAIYQTVWDKIYKKQMDIVRPFVKENVEALTKSVNDAAVAELENKYAKGNISKWEMDSISYYFHEHELKNLNHEKNGLSHFDRLPQEPRIDTIITIKGKQVPLFKIERIAGTVLAKDKAHKTITLLTVDGVVLVKIFGDAFANYDRQISSRGADGKKHVIEKSWFTRGEKLIITGIKRDTNFIAKKYSKTPHHLVEKIIGIENDLLVTQGERMEG